MKKATRWFMAILLLTLGGSIVGCKSDPGTFNEVPLVMSVQSPDTFSVLYSDSVQFSVLVEGDPTVRCQKAMNQDESSFEEFPRGAISSKLTLSQTSGPGLITATYQAASTKWEGPVKAVITCTNAHGRVVSHMFTINLVEPNPFVVDSMTPKTMMSTDTATVLMYTSNCSGTTANRSIGYEGTMIGDLKGGVPNVATTPRLHGCHILGVANVVTNRNTPGDSMVFYARRGNVIKSFKITIVPNK